MADRGAPFVVTGDDVVSGEADELLARERQLVAELEAVRRTMRERRIGPDRRAAAHTVSRTQALAAQIAATSAAAGAPVDPGLLRDLQRTAAAAATYSADGAGTDWRTTPADVVRS